MPNTPDLSPSPGKNPLPANNHPVDSDGVAHWRQQVIEGQQNLFDFDAAVLAGQIPPNPKQRFALDLLLRCSELRYGALTDPIEAYVR